MVHLSHFSVKIRVCARR